MTISGPDTPQEADDPFAEITAALNDEWRRLEGHHERPIDPELTAEGLPPGHIAYMGDWAIEASETTDQSPS